jgi:hypothetical protein
MGAIQSLRLGRHVVAVGGLHVWNLWPFIFLPSYDPVSLKLLTAASKKKICGFVQLHSSTCYFMYAIIRLRTLLEFVSMCLGLHLGHNGVAGG